MEIEIAAARYQQATRGLRLLSRLTPHTVDTDRQQLLAYTRDGQRRHLPWELAGPADISANLRDVAEEIATGGGEIAYVNALREAAEGLELATEGDPDGFGSWSRRRYGTAGDELVALATELIAHEGFEELPRRLSAADMAELAQRALSAYDLDDWSIEVRPGIGARMMVSGHKLVIRAAEFFSDAEARRLIVHEVGSHALRRANADLQGVPLLVSCPFSDAWTEEGLAVWNEHALGVSMPATQRIYAARVLAIATAEHAGIYAVLDSLLAWRIEPEFAVDTAIRAKRGYRDPDGPGAFHKDLAYLGGYLEVNHHLESSPQDLPLLMASKWPFARLAELRVLSEREDFRWPAYLPDQRLLF